VQKCENRREADLVIYFFLQLQTRPIVLLATLNIPHQQQFTPLIPNKMHCLARYRNPQLNTTRINHKDNSCNTRKAFEVPIIPRMAPLRVTRFRIFLPSSSIKISRTGSLRDLSAFTLFLKGYRYHLELQSDCAIHLKHLHLPQQ
jgi:hypothetical protein